MRIHGIFPTYWVNPAICWPAWSFCSDLLVLPWQKLTVITERLEMDFGAGDSLLLYHPKSSFYTVSVSICSGPIAKTAEIACDLTGTFTSNHSSIGTDGSVNATTWRLIRLGALGRPDGSSQT